MNYPKTFQELVDFFKLLPGVGKKTAERYAFSLFNYDDDKLEKLSDILKDLKLKVITCPNCGCLAEANKCFNCLGENKKSDIICVVENQKNVFIFENLGFSNIKYHVLGGLISPMDGINPEDINLKQLVNRINNENIKEIILALKSGVEGSTTSLYIRKLLENKNIKITQIAQGIPIGTDMEYLDGLTLEMALQNRNELS